MKLLNDLNELTTQPTVVLTIGVFDGVHLGHQALIGGTVAAAQTQNASSAVLTFNPHPDNVLRPDKPVLLLTDLADKAALIAKLGVDLLIVQPFTPEFAHLSPQAFVENILAVANLKEIHVGENFVFGYKAQGTVAFLKEMGVAKGFAVKSLELGTQTVNSSRIRRLIMEGEVGAANSLLGVGRYYALKGNVLHGNERGRTLGFPTANLATNSQAVVPANGVYATRTTLPDGTLVNSVTNVGNRPTFDNGVRSVETYLLDWSGDLYEQEIRVEFVQKLRDERKFGGLDELKAQLNADVMASRHILANL